MKSLLSSSDLKKNTIENFIWQSLKEITKEEEGYLYYRYPITGMNESYIPTFSIIDYNNGIVLIDVQEIDLDQIHSVQEENWTLNGSEIENPMLRLEDYKVSLDSIIRRYRQIRDKIPISYYIYLPTIQEKDFVSKFSNYQNKSLLFGDVQGIVYSKLFTNKCELDENEKTVFISVTQGAGSLIGNVNIVSTNKARTMGDAIKLLDKKMAILDSKQHEASIQIPDGPQRIRGMAGTGKTVILAMKAAFLHGRYPNAKILYTFHTQSLYNQVRNLITRFYQEQNNAYPNWDNLLVLHSWGGKNKEGVYYRTCQRNSLIAKNYQSVPYGTEDALDYVCSLIIHEKISEEFDYVLMDESQDFPSSFFKLIYTITKEPKRIIFAYDELQSLTTVDIKDVKELFGYDENGKPLVDFSSPYYAEEIDKDIILDRSYRNPYELLMVAHGLGMGIYNNEGIMQIIDDEKIWNSIGYEIESGTLKKNEPVVINRSRENTISLVHECYCGNEPTIKHCKFENISEEISWIADSISNDCNIEGVDPHHIVVISLNKNSYKSEFPTLQNHLFGLGIPSLIPGYEGVERDKFGEKGQVTLSTVFKAKGNEAFIIYVMSIEYIYDYLEFVQARNSVFTALTRTKGWCRITGCGEDMDRAIMEIDSILANLPRFKFVYPDAKKIARKLSQEEYARRVAATKKAKKSVESLLAVDAEALKTLPKDQIGELIKRLQENADK